MSKQLRLDVAQLTDVGRKRPHNEDNMAYVIPKDMQVMTRKGALFIVADGMGGHAAGEVASEIAVDTVSNVYYQDDSDDIPTALLHAIRRANALIHQRAAEDMLRSGMGTTCVAAVLRGSTAFIANVGDSRAYLIRRGLIRQISQDHSWVEEQVRAGLLTRDQARSHAQRNVITRCLGTQAEVEIDVFTEVLEEGDSLILCTDGLSGLISEEELRVTVEQYAPQESVYHLVERANENGGPDNITAIVIRVEELGWEPPGTRYPVYVGGREMASEDTAVLGRLPGSLGLPARSDNGRTISAPLRLSSGPLLSPEQATIPQPMLPPARPRRKRTLYPVLAVFVLLVLALAGGSAYYFFLRGPSVNADTLISQASQLVNEAQAEVTGNPSDALQKLAQAQADMRQAQTVSLSSTQQTRLRTLLQGNFTTTAKAAITSYNRQALITPLSLTTPCVNTTAAPVSSGSTNTQAASLAVIQDGKGNLFSYALGTDHNLYPLNTQHSFGNKVALPQPQVTMLASDSQRLFALMVQPGKDNGPSSYSLGLLTAKPSGDLQVTNTVNIDPNLMKGGLAPKLITAWGNDVYVLLTSDSTPNTAEILDYTADKNNKLNGNPHSARISVSTSVISIAAFSGGQLFLLYSNGDVQSLQFASPNQAAVSVVLQSPIAPSLAVSPSEFTPATPVPTSAAQPTRFLSVPGATLLAAGTVGGSAHLYIADGAYHRILDLQEAQVPTTPTATATSAKPTPTATGAVTGGGVAATGAGSQGQVTMQLVQQYASATLLPTTNSLVVDPKGANVYLLVQNPQNSATLNLLSIQLQTQNSCTP
ncbi:MAG TPA: Stp1/IreP family PP2C-type Ser/Thr phosphatase [Ktedonobacteraceae bacterium]|nr:Stp1/IreP family PP2C-type Ser/Thr phosphatase [Ktedonobacteraceae bacterium]